MKYSKNKRLFDFNLPTLIVGMGTSGLSCARYLSNKNCSFDIADSRDDVEFKQTMSNQFNTSRLLTGDFNFLLFKNYAQIIVSPGISIRSRLFIELQQQGCFILGDVELFAQAVDKPVIAITGSNGKSTVTTLVENIAQYCGLKAIAGGNLGIAALDLLETNSDLYILELSSFQLESCYSLQTLSAVVLNVSADHMDRYNDLDDYRRVKENIYQYCQYAVLNCQENITTQRIKQAIDKGIVKAEMIFFGEYCDASEQPEYYLSNGKQLMRDEKKLLSASEIKIKGKFNYLNILAAMALLKPLALNNEQQLQAIKEYRGLPHRCEWLASIDGVDFYNDSKGTNTGATMAAINSVVMELPMEKQKSVVLIAGGVAKDADFKDLGKLINHKIKFTVLLGVDALQIKSSAIAAGAKNDQFYLAQSMREAVLYANNLAKKGDVILLSPACASFDMYKNYQQRGEDFKKNVVQLQRDLKHVG